MWLPGVFDLANELLHRVQRRYENVFVPVKIIPAETPAHFEIARTLFCAYAAGLSVDLAFQHFAGEVRDLPGRYAPPAGVLLLAFVAEEPAGCGAMRDLGNQICEMKRLYVLPEFRGTGLGLTLAHELIAAANKIGYRAMRLDTLPEMRSAHKLYQSLGFREIAPYCLNPIEGTRFMELQLGDTAGAQSRR